MPYFILNPVPIRNPSPRGHNNRTACGQVFWLPDHSPAAPSHPFRIVTSSGLCPRLQRRDRDGLAPSSLSPGGATRRDMAPSYYSPSRLSRRMSGGTSSLPPASRSSARERVRAGTFAGQPAFMRSRVIGSICLFGRTVHEVRYGRRMLLTTVRKRRPNAKPDKAAAGNPTQA